MEMNFQKLTPTNDVSMDVYDKAFEFVFKNDDIKNVAISGIYGAGKSSLLETYKKCNPKIKFLHISLAHFTPNEEAEPTRDKRLVKTPIEVVLEGKIINQIIQQVDKNDIPQTLFNVKREYGEESAKRITYKVVAFLLGLFYMLNYSKVTQWVLLLQDNFMKPVLQWITNPYSVLLVCVGLVILLGEGIHKLTYGQRLEKIVRKISFQGNEIELFSEDKTSYFDKYLDEVLYLFEQVKADAIVFEDIDRFNSVIIFERLREINALLNIRLRQKNRTLRFLYLLRDDIFESKERIKFFDYILPVIPVVDNSNSYDKLKEFLETTKGYEQIKDVFLRKLCLFIDDMRVLKNIGNEYLVYSSKLENTKPDQNKMLAMVTYKNIFPKDYADLQQGKGYVNTVFENSTLFRASVIQNYENKIMELKNKRDIIESEHLKDEKELEMVKERMFNDYRQIPTYQRAYDEAKKKYELWVSEEYPIRKNALIDGKEKCLDEIDEEIETYQREKALVEKKALAELISDQNEELLVTIMFVNDIGKKETFDAVKSSRYFGLLKYLLSRGYIDETYKDYMTFFYENSMVASDKHFLREVMYRKEIEWDYHIADASTVIDNMDIFDFEWKGTLNFDLLAWLLKTDKHEDKLLQLIKQIKARKSFEFVALFYQRTEEKKRFVSLVNTLWPSYFSEAVKTVPKGHLDDYSIDTLMYTPLNVLQQVDDTKILSEYISERGEFIIRNHDEQADELMKAFEVLDIVFIMLPACCENILFDRIYESNRYVLNRHNLDVLLLSKYKVEWSIKKIQYLSLVLSQPKQPLYLYVKQNLRNFLSMLLETKGVRFMDESADVVQVLNALEGEDEVGKKLIHALEIIIEDLSQVLSVSYKKELLDVGKVKYSEDNILNAFVSLGLSDETIDFINSNESDIDFRKSKMKDEIKFLFWDQCVSCANITNPKYESILTTINRKFEIFDVAGVSEDKMNILIAVRGVQMNAETLMFIRDNYPFSITSFIRANVKEYVNIAVGSLANTGEVEQILSWDICDEYKLKLLSEINDEVAITSLEYGDDVLKHILDYNFNLDDLPLLCQEYDCCSMEIQKKICTLAMQNLDKVQEAENVISIDLICELAKVVEEEHDYAILVEIIAASIGRISVAKCIECLCLMGMDDVAELFNRKKRPTIMNNEYNYIIMQALKDNEYLKEFWVDIEKNVIRYKRVKD